MGCDDTTQQVLDQLDDLLDDWSVGPDAMRRGAPAHDPAPAGLTPETVTVVLMPGIDQFLEAMARAADALLEFWPKLKRIAWEFDAPKRRAQHVEYHRRRRSRARRGRR